MVFRLIITMLLLSLSVMAQKKKSTSEIHIPTREEYDILEKRMDCLHKNKYKPYERLKFFPFNRYKKVVLISFEWPEPLAEIIIKDTDSIAPVQPRDTIPDLNTEKQWQEFYLSITKETKILSSQEITRLTNILYNIGYRSNQSYHGFRIGERGYSCYNPRNAILFLDEHDNLKEHIEFCFECHQHRLSSEKIKTGQFCNQKYKLLQAYFKSVGIKYVKGSYQP